MSICSFRYQNSLKAPSNRLRSYSSSSIFDDDFSNQQKPIQRQKSVRKCSEQQKEKSHIERYNFVDLNQFDKLLCLFNENLATRTLVDSFTSNPYFFPEPTVRVHETDARFAFVGFVNVCMKMCFRCRDQGKHYKIDRYYVDVLEKAQMRTALCYGCLGALLNKMRFYLS